VIIEVGGSDRRRAVATAAAARRRPAAGRRLRSARSGALLGALAREARSASLVAVLVVLPIVFLGLIPRRVVPPGRWASDVLPFAHAVRFFSAALYDLDPWDDVLREGLWLVVLGALFGGLARTKRVDCWRELVSSERACAGSAERRLRSLVRETRLDLSDDFVFPLSSACDRAEPGAAGARPPLGRRPRRRGGGGGAARRQGADPVRDPRGEGRGRLGCLGRRGGHPARAARSA
jgi:hypothetical protein